jgi:hypothetical protein
VLDRQGSRLETLLGTPLAAGAGYTDTLVPQPVNDGEAWLYVTGQVQVLRGNPVVNGPAMEFNPAANEFSVLAERQYAIATECLLAAVLVQWRTGEVGSA